MSSHLETAGQRPSDASAIIDEAAGLRFRDPEQAKALVEQLQRTRICELDPHTRAQVKYVHGQLLLDTGAVDYALASFRSARHHYLLSGQDINAIEAELGTATAQFQLGHATVAIEIAQTVLDGLRRYQSEQSVEITSARARAHLSLASFVVDDGRADEALTHLDRAWDYFRAVGDRAGEACVEQERGATYLKKRMPNRALDDLQRAYDEFEELSLPIAAARCVIPIAWAMHVLGRGREAVNLLDETRSGMDGKLTAADAALLRLESSEVLLRVGMLHDARLEAECALGALLELGMLVRYAAALRTSGLALLGLGYENASQDRFDTAARLLSTSGPRSMYAKVLVSRSVLAMHAGNMHRLHELSSRVLDLADAPELEASAYLGMVFAHPDHPESPGKLEAAKELIDNNNLRNLVRAEIIARARLQRRTGDAKGAWQLLRSTLLDPDANTALGSLNDATTLRNEIIGLLIDRGTHAAIAEAWQWSTVEKQQVLKMTYAAEPVGGVSGELKPAEAFATLSHTLDRAQHSDEAVAEVREAQARLGMAYRRNSCTRQASSTLSEDTIALPRVPERPGIYYHVLGSDVIIFVVRDGQVEAHRVSDAARLTADALHEWSLECAHVSHQSPAGVLAGGGEDEVIASLSELLVAPIADLLRDLSGERLDIVLHRQLNQVPFAALRIGQSTMAQTFSMRSVLNVAPRGRRTDAASGQAREVLTLAVDDANMSHVERETKGVEAAHDNVLTLRNEDASTSALAENASHFDVVHIACHGTHDDLFPAQSGLRLGDRWLTAAEASKMTLDGALVVLNACGTGHRYDTNADANGLVSAFLSAGASGVVATTWLVDDGVAADFAENFHLRLASGHAPPEATRHAAADVAESYPHPWAWAAFRYSEAALTD